MSIEYDERFVARPWGIICSCGWKGCAADEVEAQQVKAAHLAREEFGIVSQ